MSTYNWSLLSILGVFGVAMIPHVYAVVIVESSKTGAHFDNANPRTQSENLKTKLPTATYNKYMRAQAASSNGMENLAFWGVAVLAGNLAKLPAESLNTHATVYLASRFIYNFLYINISSNKWSNLRSAVWLVGVGAIGSLLVKASSALNA